MYFFLPFLSLSCFLQTNFLLQHLHCSVPKFLHSFLMKEETIRLVLGIFSFLKREKEREKKITTIIYFVQPRSASPPDSNMQPRRPTQNLQSQSNSSPKMSGCTRVLNLASVPSPHGPGSRLPHASAVKPEPPRPASPLHSVMEPRDHPRPRDPADRHPGRYYLPPALLQPLASQTLF